MLILTRRPGETIIITPEGCEPITVQVVDVDRGKTRIGVSARRTVTIHRGEIQRRIDDEFARTVWGTVDLGGEG